MQSTLLSNVWLYLRRGHRTELSQFWRRSTETCIQPALPSSIVKPERSEETQKVII